MNDAPKIYARQVELQDAEGRPVARGSIILDGQGVPQLILWDALAFLFLLVTADVAVYREVRPLRPGDSFEAVP